jgi:hypothetical protein
VQIFEELCKVDVKREKNKNWVKFHQNVTHKIEEYFLAKLFFIRK